MTDKLTDEIKQKLLSYQIPHTEQLIKILEKHNRVLDSSDTGTGKSYSAIAACLAIKLKPLIICPKSVISSWKKVIDFFNAPYYGISNYESIQNCKYYTKTSGKNKLKCPFIKRTEDVEIDTDDNDDNDDDNDDNDDNDNEIEEEKPQTKKIDFSKMSDIAVLKYMKKIKEDSEIILKEKKEEEKYKNLLRQNKKSFKKATETQESINGSLPPKENKIKKNNKKYLYSWVIPDDMVVIFDEAHRCKNLKTIASVLLYTLSNTTTVSLLDEQPSKIMMLSATIADKPSNFALCGYVLGLYPSISKANTWMNKTGENFSNPMLGVHHVINNEYASGMRIKELGDLFPKNQVVANCYDMDCAKEIQEQYKIIEDAIENLKKKEVNTVGIGAVQIARMTIEMKKVPTYIELAKKYLEEGNAVAIFVNFTESLKTIAKELNTACIVYGDQTLEERDKNIADFNADKERVIVLNANSGSVGLSLHDLNGKYPRVSIISPNWSAVTILQSLGRTFRANGQTPVRQYIVYAANTVEESICENMKDKIVNIALINDGNTDAYQIEGLTDESTDTKLSEFDRTFLKVNALHAKRKRLQDDLKETEDELKELEQIINNWF